MNVYLETSFLVSVYSVDSNFEAAVQVMEKSSDEFLMTTFGELEIVTALELRVFRKEMTIAQARFCLEHFNQDMEAGLLQLRELPDLVFHRARELSLRTTARLGTRTGDILHVAAALELGVEAFYSFDKQQRKLAQAVKLKVNSY